MRSFEDAVVAWSATKRFTQELGKILGILAAAGIIVHRRLSRFEIVGFSVDHVIVQTWHMEKCEGHYEDAEHDCYAEPSYGGVPQVWVPGYGSEEVKGQEVLVHKTWVELGLLESWDELKRQAQKQRAEQEEKERVEAVHKRLAAIQREEAALRESLPSENEGAAKHRGGTDEQ